MIARARRPGEGQREGRGVLHILDPPLTLTLARSGAPPDPVTVEALASARSVGRLKAAERRPPNDLCTRRVTDPAIWDIPPGPDCALLWDTSADKSRSCGSSLADVLSRIGLG